MRHVYHSRPIKLVPIKEMVDSISVNKQKVAKPLILNPKPQIPEPYALNPEP